MGQWLGSSQELPIHDQTDIGTTGFYAHGQEYDFATPHGYGTAMPVRTTEGSKTWLKPTSYSSKCFQWNTTAKIRFGQVFPKKNWNVWPCKKCIYGGRLLRALYWLTKLNSWRSGRSIQSQADFRTGRSSIDCKQRSLKRLSTVSCCDEHVQRIKFDTNLGAQHNVRHLVQYIAVMRIPSVSRPGLKD